MAKPNLNHQMHKCNVRLRCFSNAVIDAAQRHARVIRASAESASEYLAGDSKLVKAATFLCTRYDDLRRRITGPQGELIRDPLRWPVGHRRHRTHGTHDAVAGESASRVRWGNPPSLLAHRIETRSVFVRTRFRFYLMSVRDVRSLREDSTGGSITFISNGLNFGSFPHLELKDGSMTNAIGTGGVKAWMA